MSAAPAPEGPTLASYIRPHKRALVVGAGMLLATNVLDKAVPLVLRRAIDALTAGRAREVLMLAGVVVAMASVLWGVRTASRVRIFNVGRDVEYDLRSDLLTRLHLLGPAFFQRMPTGEIMSRATNDVGQLRLLVGFGGLNAINSVFAYTFGIGVMAYLSPKLLGYAILPYPLLLLISRGFGRLLFSRSQRTQQILGQIASSVQETLSGLRVTRAYGTEVRDLVAFEALNETAVAANMQLALLRGLMWPLLALVSALGKLLVTAVGVQMILDGEPTGVAHEPLTAGGLVAFLALLVQLDWPTLALGYLLGIIQRGRASFERVREILVAEPDVRERPDAVEASREGRVEVRGLSFARGGRPVLEDVSFAVPAGGSVAIVGTVGSGKSTLAALLARLLPTPEGSVFLDGVDVHALTLRSLRRTIGYAQQEPFLFSTTVARNIAFAAPDLPDATLQARIRAASEEAAIRDEIEALPEGFDTLVGERGVQLSGGQKQRVSLARALIADPSVLVLDDPMSAVDARTEAHILQAIERASRGRTLVLITNRVEAAKRCDHVLVLDAGRVIERGTHDELVARDGLYARLAETQALETELGLR